MWLAFGLIASLAVVSSVNAQPVALKPALAGLGFLVGDWSSGTGQVPDTGGAASGRSKITVEVGGSALLRRDHTELRDKAGEPAGGFDQIMLIYPEGGDVHADYSDGAHVIHYTSAVVTPGRSVVFSSAAAPGAPVFRLGYTLADPKTLAVAFAMAPPGRSDFHPIATGTLTRP